MAEQDRRRWSLDKRLKFIEFRLFWEGKVNRSDLAKFFRISIPQASADIKAYLELAPDNMTYNKSAKTYLASPDFKPLLHHPHANRYLSQVRFVTEKIMPESSSWLGWTPPHDFLPTIVRHVDPQTLRIILQAIHSQTSVKVRYQSISGGEALWRQLSPHALGSDGMRWHVRAWCHLKKRYRDFVFARILEIEKTNEAAYPADQDWQWNEVFMAKIGPNPKLGEGERKAIELDYGMHDGVLEIGVRLALWRYMERQLRLDVDIEKIEPQKQHITLLNRNEIEQKLQVDEIEESG